MKGIVLLAALGLVIVANPGYTQNSDPVIARAGDYLFRQSDFMRLMSYSPASLQEQLSANPQQMEQLVRRIMQHKIIAGMAKKEGFENKAEVKEQLQYVVDEFLAREYLTQSVAEKVVVAEDDARRYYEKNLDKFAVPEEVQARHILVRVPFGGSDVEKREAKEKATNILEWLRKGEKFETLAARYSEDPNSKDNGGELGYFPRGKMPKAFDSAAFSLKPGEISDIVETDHGYHIINVENRIEARLKSFEEVKSPLIVRLRGDLVRSSVEEFVRKAEKDAGLEIFPVKLQENKK